MSKCATKEVADYKLSRYAYYLIVQTESKLKKNRINNEKNANITHHKVGKEVRETIKRLGGTLPENLPTPEKSISQIELEELNIIVIKTKKM